MHRDTVRRVLREHQAVLLPGAPLRQSLIDPYRDFIGQTLEKWSASTILAGQDDWRQPEKYPTLAASRLHHMVCERGYAGLEKHGGKSGSFVAAE